MPPIRLLRSDSRRLALTETGLVTILLVGALWQFDQLDHLDFGRAGRDAFTVLALAASGISAAAAAIAKIGQSRLAIPLAFYAAAMIPAGVIQSTAGWTTVAKFIASSGFLILLASALAPDRRIWPATAAVALAAVVAATVEDDFDGASLLAQLIMVGGWWLTAAGFVAVGAIRHHPPTWRIGIGLSMLAWAHLEAFTEDFSEGPGVHMPDLEFGGLRVLGLLVVLFALTQRGKTQPTLERRLAERDHEIRNVLSGLSGVSRLLCAETLGRSERAALASAVRAELDRMQGLVNGNTTHDDETLVRPLLTQLVALRRARGEEIRLRVEGHPRVRIPAHELAQVVTNLLANCDRHEPGASVRVAARAEEDHVCITVTDDGPGLTHGTRYNASAGGSGLGLQMCRRLLEAHDGTLSVRATGHGCRAEMRLPVAGAVLADAG